MIAAYSAADLVVHPSLQEIFPNAVGEAMACARPVSRRTRAAPRELLGRDGSAGVLVPPADADALADAVRRLLDDPARLRGTGRGGAPAHRGRSFRSSAWSTGTSARSAEVIGGGG